MPPEASILKLLLIALSLCAIGRTCLAWAEDATGFVCLGRNLAKVSTERSERLYLRVDDSPKIYFADPYEGPRIVVRDFDVNTDHLVKVYFDDEVVQSWKFSFDRLKTRAVLLWRSAGAWRMEAIEVGSCNEDA